VMRLSSLLSVSVSRVSRTAAVPRSQWCRGLTHIPVPVDRSPRFSPDGIYRRPPVPLPQEPIPEDGELIWHDGQAPEPVFDRYNTVIPPYLALIQCIAAVAGTYFITRTIVKWINPEARQTVEPQQFPFNNLVLERGGSITKQQQPQQQQ